MKLRERSARNYGDNLDDDEDEIDGRRTFDVQSKLDPNRYNTSLVQHMKAKDVTLDYLQQTGFQHPIMVLDKTGLGLRVPSRNFTVSDVKKAVGSRRMVDVMDVLTQQAAEMTMKDWTEYFENPVRDRLLNVISLEISHTPLDQYVESPAVVRQVDWVDCAWPLHLKTSQKKATNTIADMMYPKVQKYCLMSVGGCFTDFHIDFGGSSVWYHVLRGKKLFWLIPPTAGNLDQYEQWVLSGKQGEVFLGDKVEGCQLLEINEGNTFLMPSGWIHAVYTPCDSLVFGGNFIHSFNIGMQLRIYSCEEKTKVPVKFRYPFFEEMQWYVLERYIHRLTGISYLRKLDGDNDSDDLPPGPRVVAELPMVTPSVITKRPRGRPPKRLAGSSPPPLPSDTAAAASATVTTPVRSSVIAACTNIAASLTSFELRGLRELLVWVQTDPRGSMSIPHLLKWPGELVAAAEALLGQGDIMQNVCPEKFILQWPEEHLKKYSVQMKRHQPGADVEQGHPISRKSAAGIAGAAASASSLLLQAAAKRRRVRCKKCEPCTRDDCRECQYCVDMKKYGGSGRMKKTCMARQCLTPILPHGVVCSICKLENDRGVAPIGNVTEDDLRECLACLDIVHPQCLRAAQPGLGDAVENEDQPNSWKCPMCVAAEDGSEEPAAHPERMPTNGTEAEPQAEQLETAEPMEGDEQSAPSGHSSSTGDGHEALAPKAQGAMDRKRNLVAGTINRLRSKFNRIQRIQKAMAGIKRKPESPDDSLSSATKKRAVNTQFRGESPVLEKGNAAAKPPPSEADAIMTLQQCHQQDIERKILMQQRNKRNVLKKKFADKENEEASVASSAEEHVDSGGAADQAVPEAPVTRETVKKQPKGAAKQGTRQPLSTNRSRKSRCGQCEYCALGNCGSCLYCLDMPKYGGSGRLKQACMKRRCILQEQEEANTKSQQAAASGEASNGPTVTASEVKAEPAQAVDMTASTVSDVAGDGRGGVAAVSGSAASPVEALDAHTQAATGHQQQQLAVARSAAPSKSSKVAVHSNAATDINKMAALQKITKGYRPASAVSFRAKSILNKSKDRKLAVDATAASKENVGDLQLVVGSNSRHQLAKEVAEGSDDSNDVTPVGEELPLERRAAAAVFDPTQEETIWTSVLSLLGQRDLVRCMAVCKLWYSWISHSRFWKTVDLSQRHVSSGALAFAVARQPTVLRLGFSDVAVRPLQYALGRMGSLRVLQLNNTSRETVLGALGCSPTAAIPPLLDTLDVAWVQRLDDEALKQLLMGGGAASALRLQRITTLSLRGTDVGDTTLRLLTRCMPRLSSLDVSRCDRITDVGVNFLTCSGSSVQQALTEFNASSCRLLTSACLGMLKKCPLLTSVDLRNCANVSSAAVADFANSDPKKKWSNKDKRLLALQ